MQTGGIMITTQNKKLDIYNQVATIEDYKKKLMEEVYEVMQENKVKELASELMDVTQLCINMLVKLEEDFGIKNATGEHFKKLERRGWEYEKVVVYTIVDKAKGFSLRSGDNE